MPQCLPLPVIRRILVKPRDPIHVLGAGGHAKVVVAALQSAGMDVAGIYDDDPVTHGQHVLGVPVLGGLNMLASLGQIQAVCAIGNNETRRRVVSSLESIQWVSVIHPAAWVHESVKIGVGTVVFAGAVIQPDTIVGAHSIVNTGATVDHDCRIGDYVHLAPGVHLAGDVTVNEGSFLGIGAVVIPGVHIGAWTTVGAGAAVLSDLSDGVTAVGVPARAIR